MGTKSTDTVAVATKAGGRSETTRQHHLSKVTLAPQCSYVAVAKYPKHRPQYLDSCETKYNALFRSTLVCYHQLLLSFHLARLGFRQRGSASLVPTEETTKSISSLSTAQRAYPVSRKISSKTMQNYGIIICFLSRQALYHCAVLMEHPSKFWDIFVSRLNSVINLCH